MLKLKTKLTNIIVSSVFALTCILGISDTQVVYAAESVHQVNKEVFMLETPLDKMMDGRKEIKKALEEIQEEKRLKELEDAKKDIPIEKRIGDACEEYGIDYNIVIAIARLETGWFRSDAFIYGNNPGGLSVNEQPIYFDTIDEGVDRFVSNLANNYFAIGLDTVEEIGQKYCPVNPDWANLVRSVMYSES